MRHAWRTRVRGLRDRSGSEGLGVARTTPSHGCGSPRVGSRVVGHALVRGLIGCVVHARRLVRWGGGRLGGGWPACVVCRSRLPWWAGLGVCFTWNGGFLPSHVLQERSSCRSRSPLRVPSLARLLWRPLLERCGRPRLRARATGDRRRCGGSRASSRRQRAADPSRGVRAGVSGFDDAGWWGRGAAHRPARGRGDRAPADGGAVLSCRVLTWRFVSATAGGAAFGHEMHVVRASRGWPGALQVRRHRNAWV